MNLNKIIKLVFFSILLLGLGIIVPYILKLNDLIEGSEINDAFIDRYNSLQKHTNVISIIFFVAMLVTGLIYYYKFNKANYLVLAAIPYIMVTLHCYISVNQRFYQLQHINPTESGSFWIITFIGIFYIIGAILISVIGYFAIRNLLQRNTPKHRINNKK